MFQQSSNPFFLFQFVFALFFTCCAFVDLRPIGISTTPQNPAELLPYAESPAAIHFDTAMEKSSVEKAFQIYSHNGISEGEFHWEGNSLFFTPAYPWKPGIRYALKVSGTVTAEDGREQPVSIDVPFYAVSYSVLPCVVSFFPDDCASTGIAGDIILEINFSLPMDKRSAENALKFDVPGEKTFVWHNDNKTLLVKSSLPLNSWTIYRWSISEKASSIDGAPLAKEVSGSFITDLDREFLKVVRAVPLIPPESFSPSAAAQNSFWGLWTQAESGMEQLGSGQGIGVLFNKPLDEESLRRSFNIVPPLPCRVEIISPVKAVFIPAQDPEPETEYRLCITGTLEDSGGMKMGEDYNFYFTAGMPFLNILSVSSGSNETVPESGSVFTVKLNTGGILRCVINFSQKFDPDNYALREESVFRISLRPFFPGNLPPVGLRSASWLSADRLFLEWEGLLAGQEDKINYYKLLIPGGFHNGLGSGLKEDFILYMETEE